MVAGSPFGGVTVNMFQVWAACLCAVACSHAGWKGLSGEGLGGVSAQVLQVGHLDFHWFLLTASVVNHIL